MCACEAEAQWDVGVSGQRGAEWWANVSGRVTCQTCEPSVQVPTVT